MESSGSLHGRSEAQRLSEIAGFGGSYRRISLRSLTSTVYSHLHKNIPLVDLDHRSHIPPQPMVNPASTLIPIGCGPSALVSLPGAAAATTLLPGATATATPPQPGACECRSQVGIPVTIRQQHVHRSPPPKVVGLVLQRASFPQCQSGRW